MKLCIRAHDLGVRGTEDILGQLERLGLDGVQMVCYKVYDGIPYEPNAITQEKAAEIGGAFSCAGKIIPLVGAYFNPVHPDREKAAFYAGVDKFRASALDESFMYSVTAFYRQAAGSMP